MRLLTLVGLGPLLAGHALAQDTYFYGGLGVGGSGIMVDELAITNGLLPLGVRSVQIDRDDRDITYKLFAGYQFNRFLAVETGFFNLGKFSFDSRTLPTGNLHGLLKFQGMNLDLVGTMPVNERFSLLGRVGAVYTRTRDEFSGTGAVVLSNPNPSERDTNLKVGLGMQYAFSPSVLLRGEAEHYRIRDAVGHPGAINAVTVSLVFPFGRVAQASPPMAPPPAYVAPPPPPPVVVAPPPPPAPVVVMPPERRRVSFTAESLFGFDKSQLRPEGQAALDGFARELEGTRFDSISVEGHTDRLGSSTYNQTLSLQRADAVKGYLVSKGRVDPMKIQSVGQGETQPVTKPEDCKGNRQTPALVSCLQPDRRVEIEVTGTR